VQPNPGAEKSKFYDDLRDVWILLWLYDAVIQWYNIVVVWCSGFDCVCDAAECCVCVVLLCYDCIVVGLLQLCDATPCHYVVLQLCDATMWLYEAVILEVFWF